jgi:hypothetical protein
MADRLASGMASCEPRGIAARIKAATGVAVGGDYVGASVAQQQVVAVARSV